MLKKDTNIADHKFVATKYDYVLIHKDIYVDHKWVWSVYIIHF